MSVWCSLDGVCGVCLLVTMLTMFAVAWLFGLQFIVSFRALHGTSRSGVTVGGKDTYGCVHF